MESDLKVNPDLTFRPRRDYYAWAVEWQRATGRILASIGRTREAGLAKLADADTREVERKVAIEKGEL
jgi:hypothetical protein